MKLRSFELVLLENDLFYRESIKMIFLLIIFFMVTTTFNNFGSVQIDLPSSTIQQTDKTKSIEIIIDKDGNYHISEDGKITQIQFSEIDSYLKTAKEATVSADKNLKYQVIMDVITKIKENGVDNLGLSFYE